MEKLKINETPVRTSRNFGVNNIKLDNISIPDNFAYFSNVDINIESVKDKVRLENFEYKKLTYGLGEILENQVKEKTNCSLKIEVNSILDKMVSVQFGFNDSNRHLAENIDILVAEKTKSTIILTYKSDDDINYYHNGVIRVLAKENSEVNVIIINFLGAKATNFLSIENELKDNSKVTYTIVDFGGKVSCTNYFSNIIGKEAVCNLNTIYLGKENQIFDLNYIDEIRGEKAKANIEVQGALNDKAVKHFKGTIDFKKGSKKAKGDENEFCMLLSDKAKSKALPMLLCTEEEVEGNHSSAAGKIEDDKLFYIMSRGLSEKDAMKLIVKAKFNKILETIKDEKLKEEIVDEIDKRLD